MSDPADAAETAEAAAEEVEYEHDNELTNSRSDGGAEHGVEGAVEDDVGAEEVEEEEMFSHLGSSADDPEQKRRYIEYLGLIKEIDCQNKMIDELKDKVQKLCAKACKTRCEVNNIRQLRGCMEEENIKLKCLITKAMELQNFGSHRRYTDLPISTTMDEDDMAPYINCIPAQTSNWQQQSSQDDSTCSPPSCEDNQKNPTLECLCKAMGKMKICCPEDKKLIKEIAQALMCKKKTKSRQQSPCGKSHKNKRSPCQQQQRQPCPGEDSLYEIKKKLQCMQGTVAQLQQEVCQREKQKRAQQVMQQNPKTYDCGDSFGGEDDDDCQEQEQQETCYEEPDPLSTCRGKRNTKAEQLSKLKENYLYLLTEFKKKDCRLKELEKRLKGFCGGCGKKSGGGGGANEQDVEESELLVLRTRVNELKEEQDEFKCLMKEQSTQLEDYRNKYMVAQQKVEEQSVTLEKLNMNNKRIEKQINLEVKEIRSKFQEKLNELLHFPRLLENEQLKLAKICKEKEDLQGKLVIICKELKSCKSQMTEKEVTDCRPQLAKCQMELETLRKTFEEVERQRDMLCEQLKTTQDDLDTMRSESAKIIARTKERAEMLRQQLQEKIDKTERELAQCRATACLSVSDREAVIREMQGQLNTLSYSFDAAQKQIKTLRNHVAYVSNENCFPVVKC